MHDTHRFAAIDHDQRFICAGTCRQSRAKSVSARKSLCKFPVIYRDRALGVRSMPRFRVPAERSETRQLL